MGGAARLAGRGVPALAAIGAAIALARVALARVAGDSMVPTLRPSDLVVTVPVRWSRRAPAVGDVVVVTDPAGREVVKRVSAVAGGWADVMDGPVPVPPGHVAVLGDAPARSTDSRHYGPVAVEAVRARAVMALSRHRPFVRTFRARVVQAPR